MSYTPSPTERHPGEAQPTVAAVRFEEMHDAADYAKIALSAICPVPTIQLPAEAPRGYDDPLARDLGYQAMSPLESANVLA